MNILTIPLRNTWRKPTRTLLLLLVFTLGVMAIVALYQVSLVIGDGMEKKLSTYGANILISPGQEKLSVSYGGLHLGDMLYELQPLSEEKTVAAVRSIELKDRISAVAPKLVVMAKVNGTPVAVVGVPLASATMPVIVAALQTTDMDRTNRTDRTDREEVARRSRGRRKEDGIRTRSSGCAMPIAR
mgnify:CR=1 FL=1